MLDARDSISHSVDEAMRGKDEYCKRNDFGIPTAKSWSTHVTPRTNDSKEKKVCRYVKGKGFTKEGGRLREISGKKGLPNRGNSLSGRVVITDNEM